MTTQVDTYRESWGEWFDRHSRTYFIAPAVILILIFAIFPTFYSVVFALSRVKFSPTGLQFRFVWFQNFAKQFIGNEQVTLLGRLEGLSALGWIFSLAVIGLALWWLWRSVGKTSWVGMIGRIISAASAVAIALLLGATLLSGNAWGYLLTTLFYVFVGCTIQFFIGTALAFLCSQPISGKSFFRVLFFIPLDDHTAWCWLCFQNDSRYYQGAIPAGLGLDWVARLGMVNGRMGCALVRCVG